MRGNASLERSAPPPEMIRTHAHVSRLYRPAALLVAAGLLLAAAVAVRERTAGERPLIDVAALEREAAAHPDDPEVLLRIGERLRRAGERRRAFDLLARAYDRRYQQPEFVAAMGEALLETGQVPEALTLATGAAREHPESGEIQAVLAEATLEAGQYDQARAAARKAVRQAPGSARAWRALARASAANKLFAEAWPAFEHALRLAPDDGGLLTSYGEALGSAGRGAQAEQALRRALRARPRDPKVLTLLGAELGRRAVSPSQQEEAVSLLRRAVELAPRATEPRYQFGRVLLQAGSASSASSAAVALEECLRLDPQMREAWLPLARAYQALGRHAEARQAFAAYRRFSDYRREAAQLELRLRRAPDSPALLVRMAALQEKHERLEAAVHFYRRALRVRPDRRIEAHLAELQRRARAQGESPSLRPGRQTRQE